MTFRDFIGRLRRFHSRRQLDRRADAEMRFHLDMEVEAGMRRGLTRDEAVRSALLKIGSVPQAMDEVRDERRLGWLEDSATELGQAWRALRRRPAYLALGVGTLVAAVVVNTLIFSLFYGVLLRPLPYPEPDRLVRLYESSAPQPKFPVSMNYFAEIVRSNRTLEAGALYTQADMQLSHDERAEAVTAVAVTEQFFPLLGASPALGRNFLASEMAGSARVVILGHDFWTRRLNADPGIIGETLRLDREDWMVVGIAPEGFEHVGGDYRSPPQGDTVAVWRPLAMDIAPACFVACHLTNAILRLRTGVSLEAARQDLDGILGELDPNYYSGVTARLEPLLQEVVGRSQATIWILAAAAGSVLPLTCVNVAGLSIARTLTRRHELAIRAALGGGRARILRTVLAEHAVLGAVAGALGLLLASALFPALGALLPPGFPRAHELILRLPAAGFALTSAVGASLIAGLAAALGFSRTAPGEVLEEDSRAASGSHQRTRSRGSLVAVQMIMACVLCFVAILLLRSSLALDQRDHGFDPSGVVTFELAFPDDVYPPERLAAFYRSATARIAAIPGVGEAGFASSVPWTGHEENGWLMIDGYEPAPGESMSFRYEGAGPGFFESLGMRVVAGRGFDERDTADAPPAAVINETLARRFFPDRSPLGRTIDFFGPSWNIIGVVADIRDDPGAAEAEPAMWMALEQHPFGRVRGAVRVDGDPASIIPAVRQAIAAIDPELPVADVTRMTVIADRALSERRFVLWWCGVFAALALLLGAIGVYSLLAYSVGQRRREIGIRMALGATRPRVVGTVIAGGLILAVAGVTVGALTAPWAGRALSSLLYGVTPNDGIALVIAVCAILLAAALATIAPAWTAARTEPVTALRER